MSASESQLKWRSVTLLIAVAIIVMLSQSGGELLMQPRNTESMVGDTTYFNCSTNMEDRSVFWFHGNKYVYTTFGILDPYRERYRVDHNESSGSYNLVIHSVQTGDAGQYICADDDGSGMRLSAELVVLGNDPTCGSNIQLDGVIGQNVFNIPPDEVHLTCNVTYYGNIPPQLHWMKAGDTGSTIEGVVSHVRTNNRLTYSLKLKGDISLDNSSYICQTTRATQNQYKCNTETIKVLYYVGGNQGEQRVVIGEKITCVAHNSTLRCSSQWYHNNYTCPLFYDETITTHSLGIYLCTMKCNVRGTDYFQDTLKVTVFEATTSPHWLPSDKIVIAAVVPIIIIVIMAGVIVALVVLYKRKARMISEERRQFFNETWDNTRPPTVIWGIATLHQKVFISRWRCSNIEVYDSKTFVVERCMEVKGMTNPGNIVSCTINNCLYTADSKYEGFVPRILRIDPISGNLINSWNIHADKCTFQVLISIASDTNVIQTVDDNAYLHEYTADGELIRQINLGRIEGIYKVTHAVKLNDSQLVASWSGKTRKVGLLSTKPTTSPLGRLDEVEILKEFDAGPGVSINILGSPSYLSLDKVGSILYSDCENCQAVLLNPNLDEPQIMVAEEHGMTSFPRATCFNETTGKWFVADDRRIMVCWVEDDNIQREIHDLVSQSDIHVSAELNSDANC